MIFGEIVLIPFPFSELTAVKARLALVIAPTKDKYENIIVCAISSLIPPNLTANKNLIAPLKSNKLKVNFAIKIDRIVTLKRDSIIAHLGEIDGALGQKVKARFRSLVD